MAKKILVVDDDPTVTRLVSKLLADHGYAVNVAVNGQEALDMVKKEKPDLVVLDIVMPEVNGYDVCWELRFNKSYERIPIILLTETPKRIDDAVGKRTNIDYMRKPMDSKALLEKIVNLLKEPHGTA